MEDNRASTLLLCPTCQAPSRVIGTRSYQNHITRERECENGHRFSSREMADAFIDEVRQKADEYDYIQRRIVEIADRYANRGETDEQTN